MTMDEDAKILSRLIRNMKKRGVEPLTPLIDAYFMERGKPEANRLRHYEIDMMPRYRPGGRLSPSSIGGCMRQAAFKFVNMPGRVKIDPEREMIFEHGNWVHHEWQARMEDAQLVLGEDRLKVISKEEKVKIPELYIAGNSDNVLKLATLHGRKKYVIDYKSINDNGFGWISRQDEPKEEHVKQITTYGMGHAIPRGLILYSNKNNQQMKVFVIEFEHTVWAETMAWCEEVLSMLNDEELPPMHPECEAGNFLWNRCVYAHHCYGSATPVAIRRKMYKSFPGLEEAWREGNRVA